MKKSRKFIVGVGNLGLSFIELIITLAIMAVVGTTIAGAMYVSSSSYTRGAAEVNVQEEAQVALNLISDWVMDATEVESPDTQTLKITHPNEDSVNVITVYQSGDKLMYKVDTDPNAYVLCEYLADTGVTFNSTFDTDRNVNISVDFNVKGRTYHAATDTTSRNHDFTLNSTGSDVMNLYVPDNTIVLEPGMNGTAAYTFEATVYGAAGVPNIYPTDRSGDIIPSNGTVTAIGPSTYKCVITLEAGDYASADGSFKLNADYSDGANTYSDTEVITTLVRRATKAVYTNSDQAYLDPAIGEAGKAGSEYINNVDLGVTNMAPRLNCDFDNGTFAYVDPSKVEFYLRYDDGSVVPNSVYNIVEFSDHGSSPYIRIRLNQNITKDIRVYVSSVHSGSNSVTGTTVDNKATRIKHTNVSYTTGGSSYVTYFVIKKSGEDGIGGIGAGFQRGSHAFRLGALTDANATAVNNYLNAPGRSRGNYLQVVSFEYKKVGDPDFSERIYVSVRSGNENINDWALWGNSSSTQQYLADIFDCGDAYTLNVYYDLIDTTNGYTSVMSYTGTGTVNAANPFVYDKSEDEFVALSGSSIGTAGNPIVVDKNNPIAGPYGPTYNFYTYFDSYNCHSNAPYKIVTTNGVVERYKGPATRTTAELNDPNNWEPATKTPSIQGAEDVEIGTTETVYLMQDGWNHWADVKKVHFDGSDDKTVGGFAQNTFPDIFVTVVKNDCQSYQHDENGLYRVTYSTDYNGQRANISSNGSMPTASNPSGSTFTMSLSNAPSETLGTVYYEVKNF